MTSVHVMMDPAVREVALPPDLVDRLRGLAREVETAAEADLLLTGWGCPPIDGAMLARAPRIRGIFHAAGSVKDLLAMEVWERGIVVSSAAAANAAPVATYTLGMIHLSAKRAFATAAAYRRGIHKNHTTDPRLGLPGKTVGVIGASRIGRLVLQGLSGSRCGLLLSDPYVDRGDAAELGADLVELEELLLHSDIVTVHAPALPQTRQLLDARRLGLLREGAVLINTARGSLVDTDALLDVCRSGRIDAVLDVTDPEPLPPDHPLLALDNVHVTPHVAGAMGSEIADLGSFAIEEIGRYLDGRPLQGAVTLDQLGTIA